MPLGEGVGAEHLAEQVRAILEDDPTVSWDEALRPIAGEGASSRDPDRQKTPQTRLAIGEPFAAVRRRTARSLAWQSLGRPRCASTSSCASAGAIKDGNNGQLFCSLRECEELLGLRRTSAVRAFAELELKRFIVKTRDGEAGRLPASATAANGETGFSRRATQWALTDEPFNGHPPTYAFEKLSADDLKRIDEELNQRRRMGTAKLPKKQFHVYGKATHRGTAKLPIKPEMGTAKLPVEADLGHFMGTAKLPPISTIYRRPSNCPPAGGPGVKVSLPKRPWHAPTYELQADPVELPQAQREKQRQRQKLKRPKNRPEAASRRPR